MKSPRFVIGEVEGYANTGHAALGLSVVVTDSARAHRIVGQFRTEDLRGYGQFSRVRAAGRELADRLNGTLPRRDA